MDFDVENVRDLMARCETIELVRTYYSIESSKVSKRISEMVKSLAATINQQPWALKEAENYYDWFWD